MDLARRCTECGASLQGKGPNAKTCGDKCRSKRSRRLKRAAKEAGALKAMPEHQKDVAGRVRTEIPDVAHDVIEEELRPVVRESITEDTLRAIQTMVGLTPAAVEALSEDLASEDSTVRQRAYKLVLQYTVGHPAIVRAEDESAGQRLEVHFDLPRPDTPAEPEVVEAEVVDDTEEDTKECDACGQDKPLRDFIGGSDRCIACYHAAQDRAEQLMEATNRD